jgi:uncharacterized protein
MSTTDSRTAANLAVVGGIYEAFGRGDIEFILGQIADNCAWESWLDNHGQKAGLPPMKPRHGRQGVAEFFSYVATMQIQGFQVLDMLASDRQVVVEVQISIAMPDGGTVTDEELHLYSLNNESKIIRMRRWRDSCLPLTTRKPAPRRSSPCLERRSPRSPGESSVGDRARLPAWPSTSRPRPS